MSDTDRTLPRYVALIVTLAFLVLIVYQIIKAGMFVEVMLALTAIVVFVVGVGSVLVKTTIVPVMEAKTSRDVEIMAHQREMAKLSSRALEQLRTPDPTSGVNFTSADPDMLAVNLVLYSMNVYGRRSNRLAGMPIPGCSGRAWDLGVKKLQRDYGVVSTRGTGGGTFVPESLGTLEVLYNRVLLNQAVSALPEVS
jgi:hypothetical protein